MYTQHTDHQGYRDSRSTFLDIESLQYDEKLATTIRHGFIRKVYGILFSQIFLSTLIAGYLSVNVAARGWILVGGTPIMIVALIGAIGTMIALVCVPGIAQKYPANYVLLGLFTVFEAVAIGGICAVYAQTYGIGLLIKALAITTLIVGGLTAFAFQTKYDFTGWMSYMYVALLGLLGFGFIMFIFPHSEVLQTIYAAAGAVIFGIYLLIDTQLLIGKNTEMKVDEDQYIMISMSLYMDVVNIFLNILQLLAKMQGGSDNQQ